MQMQQLRYFLAVIDHGGFTRAAAHLGRTQQAVSKALGLLEAELGVRLLDRESGLPQPTAFGRELERFARGVLRDESALRHALQAARGSVADRIALGAGPTAAALVAEAVVRLARSHPTLELQVHDGVQAAFGPALREGRLDLALYTRVRPAPAPTDRDADGSDDGSFDAGTLHTGTLHTETLMQNDYRVLAGCGHPLAVRGGGCSTPELAHADWVLGSNAGDVEAAWREAFESAGVPAPAARCTTTSVEFCRRLLERNGHLSILPTALVGRELHAGTLVALEAPQFAWQRPLELACRADAAARPALLAVVQSLHEASDALRISGIS
jgi:LysR family transcriptional regulator of abg operon